ncbi:hypothetical protein M3P21_17350 [Ruegeria sp. 2012CJ41-6]|uniref:Uncharacterized protein n=1 Tax=Ruegeria spongiae TaxID=2942209 RepID=A0ABT0Q807_9RHOB|nr:hypothetical protein [Ruegeria spongiae]MCL6285298.1 hypothetical protein [Ruegeria spongiae]
MAGVNLTWVFIVIWALYGLIPVLALAALLNHAISRLRDRSGTQPGRM